MYGILLQHHFLLSQQLYTVDNEIFYMTDVNVVLLVNRWTQAYIMPFTVQYRAERLVLNGRIAL